jgi:hypothetical protein
MLGCADGGISPFHQVRDRATLHLKQLEGKAGGPEAVLPRLDVNLSAMEKALADYLAGSTDKPFNIVRHLFRGPWDGKEQNCGVISVHGHGCGHVMENSRFSSNVLSIAP